jgi:hypothetical protein
MFVRFRSTQQRLHVSVVETRREKGKVHHKHVAGFGSVPVPPSIDDRLAFWKDLHERMPKLANRLDAATQAKVLSQIHDRIPMVVVDEQRAVQLRKAQQDERFWQIIHDMHAETVESQKAAAAQLERDIAAGVAAQAAAASNLEISKRRLADLQGGKDVAGGLGRPFDPEVELRKLGWTASDLRYARLASTLPEPEFEERLALAMKMSLRADRAALRAVLRCRHRAA